MKVEDTISVFDTVPIVLQSRERHEGILPSVGKSHTPITPPPGIVLIVKDTKIFQKYFLSFTGSCAFENLPWDNMVVCRLSRIFPAESATKYKDLYSPAQ